jgi:uncharacterized SAM-binding protein YcdF (DUF218 family)
MFWIARILQTLILPPGLFLLIAAVVVVLLSFRKLRIALWLTVVALLAGCALSLEPVAAALILPLENRHAPLARSYAAGEAAEVAANAAAGDAEAVGEAANAAAGDSKRADADASPGEDRLIPDEASHIVVLGGGTEIGSPEAVGGTLATDALKRAVYAQQLHMSTGLPVVLTGGRPPGFPEAPAEAELASDLLRSLGSSDEQLLLETESRDTWENARYVDGLICNETIVLVTSAYHMPRAVRSFAAHGFTVVPAPTDYKGERAGYTVDSFLPSIHAFHDSTTALHEYMGLLYYRLRTAEPAS